MPDPNAQPGASKALSKHLKAEKNIAEKLAALKAQRNRASIHSSAKAGHSKKGGARRTHKISSKSRTYKRK